MTETAECNVRLSLDALSVFLDCVARVDRIEELVERICNQLGDLEIDPSFEVPAPPRVASIVRAASAERGTVLKSVLLMQGLAPGEPREGSIDWAGDYFTESFSMDELTGSVDFRERTSDPSIEKDQLVATVTLPELGTPGKSLEGVALAARRPAAFKFEARDGIREEEGTGRFHADITGRLRWDGSALAVDRVHIVSGNVNMASGNIHHPDAVVVSGDVEAGAELEATGSVEIKGLLDGGTVRTGGDLLVRCSLLGRTGAKVEAKGGVSAPSIRSATIEAGRDVVVAREVVTSTLRAGGALSVPRGRIVGGHAVAVEGIVVAEAGNLAGVATSLELQPVRRGTGAIVVLHLAFPGTKLVVGDYQLDLDEEVRGPVQTAIEDGRLVLQPIRPHSLRKG